MIVDDLVLLSGAPIYIEKLKLEFYQPTLMEIVHFGINKYTEAVSTLMLTKKAIENNLKEENKKELDELSDFHVVCLFISLKEKQGNSCVRDFLSILFPKYKVNFNFEAENPSIIFINNDISEMSIIEQKNYDSFMGAIKEIFSLNTGSQKEYNIRDGDAQAEAIRKRIEEGKSRRALQKPINKHSVLFNMISVLSIGMGITVKEVYEMTLYQFYSQIGRLQKRDAYDIIIRSAMAGAKIDEFPNWYEDI